MSRRVYTIDGKNFSSLEGFWDEVSDIIIPNVYWGRNLDAFNDILRGGFGTPDEGFVLVWKNSDVSKERLGFEETVSWLENDVLKNCHPANIEYVKGKIKEAKQIRGKTLFEIIIDIINNGQHKNVELILE